MHRSLVAVLGGVLLALGGVGNASASACCDARAVPRLVSDVDRPLPRTPFLPTSFMFSVEPRWPGPVPMPNVEPPSPSPVPPMTVRPPDSWAGEPLERARQRPDRDPSWRVGTLPHR